MTEDLRIAIECLPRATRIAMLEGIRTNDIIVGAYSDRGGICPMLAAHRAGGRTSFISFARAWDRFAIRGQKTRHARRATPRELLVLKSHLQASLLEDEIPRREMAEAIAEHEALIARRACDVRPPDGPAHAAGRPGEPDRTSELRRRPGWAWLRPFRRYDDYERALEIIRSESASRPAAEPSVAE